MEEKIRSKARQKRKEKLKKNMGTTNKESYYVLS